MKINVNHIQYKLMQANCLVENLDEEHENASLPRNTSYQPNLKVNVREKSLQINLVLPWFNEEGLNSERH